MRCRMRLQPEHGVVVGLSGESGERAVAELFGQRVAPFGLGDFGEAMQRARAFVRIAGGAFGDLEEAARFGVRVHDERRAAGAHRVVVRLGGVAGAIVVHRDLGDVVRGSAVSIAAATRS